MKILITGSTGRLGAALLREYGGRHEVLAPGRDALDLADEAGIRAALAPLDFDVLINPAALTNVDYCEFNEEEAFAVNARGPGVMAEVAARKGARMVQISTDYVFDGVAEGLRRESDPVNPKSVYGRAKLAGEEAVLAEDPGFLVVRTSWLFGPGNPGFLDAILERALREPRVEAIEDKDSSPTHTLDFARLLEPLLLENPVGGVLHLCNSGSCSWKEYGQAALDAAANAGLPLQAREVEGISIEDMRQFVAPRPRHTAMSTAKFTRVAGRNPRPWGEAVKACIEDYFAPRWRARNG